MYYFHHYNYPIGKITLASNGTSIVGLWIENQRFYMDVLKDKECREKETEVIKLAKHWLDAYFNNKKPSASEVPVEFIGSDFRQQVWKILAQIPYGEVITYKAIAENIATQKGIDQMSAQAVGGAVGHNPISIIIPCHRVVGTDGNLTGYSGGIEVKTQLLAFEGVDITWLYTPKQKSLI